MSRFKNLTLNGEIVIEAGKVPRYLQLEISGNLGPRVVSNCKLDFSGCLISTTTLAPIAAYLLNTAQQDSTSVLNSTLTADVFSSSKSSFQLYSSLNHTCQSRQEEGAKSIKLEIIGVICNSSGSTILFRYNISTLVEASLVFIKIADVTTRQLSMRRFKDLTLNGEIMVEAGKVPRSLQLEIPGNLGLKVVSICWLDFSGCLPTLAPTTMHLLYNSLENSTSVLNSTLTVDLFSISKSSFQLWFLWFILPLLVFVISTACFVIVLRKRGMRFCAKFKRDKYNNNHNEQDDQNNIVLSTFESTFSQKTQEALQKSKRHLKILVVFSDDHKNHRQVVVNFVNFLQADLGFEVFCELFQSQEISIDPFNWMDKSLREADKVVVIWSPGAAKNWNKDGSEHNVERNMCTPILKRIRNDLFLDVNIGKYYFGYFSYCKKSCIPEVFSQPRYFHFKLMRDFEELFFRLKGIEMYLPGGVIKEEKVKFDRYSDSSLNKYGKTLEKSINDMESYVLDHQDWHEEDLETPLHPDLSLISSSEDVESKINNLHLNIVPPSPLPTGRSKHGDTKDKKINEVHGPQSLSLEGVTIPKKIDEFETNNNNYSNSNNDHNPERCEAYSDAPEKNPPRLNHMTHESNPKAKKHITFQNGLNSKPITEFILPNGNCYCSTINPHKRTNATCIQPALLAEFENNVNMKVPTPVEHIMLVNGVQQSPNQNKLPAKQNKPSSPTNEDTITAKTRVKSLPSASKCVQLAPLDTSSDPMVSLMSLNKLSAYQG